MYKYKNALCTTFNTQKPENFFNKRKLFIEILASREKDSLVFCKKIRAHKYGDEFYILFFLVFSPYTYYTFRTYKLKYHMEDR